MKEEKSNKRNKDGVYVCDCDGETAINELQLSTNEKKKTRKRKTEISRIAPCLLYNTSENPLKFRRE